jgi:hypothetical protein
MKYWNQFWFSRADVLPMAVCRIGVGLILLTMMIGMAPNWERFYAADGMLQLHDQELYAGRVQDWYSIMNWTDSVIPVQAWSYVGLASSVGLILGWHTRCMTVVLFLLLSSMINRNHWIVNGEDLVIRMFLFYGMFSPWGTRLSLDARRRDRREPAQWQREIRELPLVWTWRLMQINFLLIYAISLPFKFAQDIGWLTGDALHWTVASDFWWERGRMSWITLSYDGWIRRLLTWGTVAVEGLAPILVWFRPTRVPMVLCIIGLHLGIACCIPGVTLFTLSMVVGATLLLPTEIYQTWSARLVSYWKRFWSSESLFSDASPVQA